MNRLLKLGLAAALLAGASSAALAQDASSSTADKPSATAIMQPNFTSFLTKLDTSSDIDISGLTASSNVKFVTIDSLEGWDATKFDEEMGERTADLTALRAKLGADADFKAKLEAAGYAIEDVVAIEGGTDSYTVYVDDRA
jgi:hypothetical protein